MMQKCVLIYDDDKELLMLCSTILKTQNYRVETRSECDNIMEDIQDIKPDLILMDLWIPKCGGERAISKVRANPILKKLPVVLFSANIDIEKISKQSGANAFVEKPFDIAFFKKTIEALI
jgi:DNA-binding NtrC family response regulator